MSHLEPQDRLGTRGVERREELLEQLRPIVRRRRWRRVGVQVGSLAVVAGVVVGAVTAMWRPSGTSEQRPTPLATVQPLIDVPPLPHAEPSLKIEVVATVQGLAQRLSREVPGVDTASDEDLMAALRASGQDPGIVRVGGQVVSVGGVWGR